MNKRDFIAGYRAAIQDVIELLTADPVDGGMDVEAAAEAAAREYTEGE